MIQTIIKLPPSASSVVIIIYILSCCVCWCSINANKKSSNEYKVVHTNYGYIRGKRMVTLYDNGQYFSYKGIPYAKPPIDELRFMPPKSIDAWAGIKDTFEYGNKCVQTNLLYKNSAVGREDCLYLNVFVPVTYRSNKLPVMVFIHGGSYSSGSSNSFGPDFLINHNVIVITFNYRLGPFGFLSLGTGKYSGNMGLKDQLLVLQWVNENIGYFGGNIDEITVFGYGAGAASLHFHLLSLQSRQFFQRAIVMSGCTINPWSANTIDNDNVELLQKIAKSYKNAATDINDLTEYIQIVDALYFSKQSHQELYQPNVSTKDVSIPWGPVVEVKDAEQPFLIDYPENLIHLDVDDYIDVMFGYTSNEMLYTLQSEIHNPVILKPFDEKFYFQLPLKQYQYNYSSEEYQLMSSDIRNFYFHKTNGKINENSLTEFTQMLSDTNLIYGLDRSTKLWQRKSFGNTFLYRFSMDTELNEYRRLSGAIERNVSGASHGDDIFYLFRIINGIMGEPFIDVYRKLLLNSTEVASIRKLTKLWTNFAKEGNPDSKLIPSTAANEIIFVDIRNNGTIVTGNPSMNIIKFWDDFYQKYENVFINNVVKYKMNEL